MPRLPIYGRRSHISGGCEVSSVVWVRSSGLGVVRSVLNVLISWADIRLVNPFHDISFRMFCISSVSRVVLLQILWARWINDLIQAVFRDQGVKLDRWMYWPVWVHLRKIVVPDEVILMSKK